MTEIKKIHGSKNTIIKTDGTVIRLSSFDSIGRVLPEKIRKPRIVNGYNKIWFEEREYYVHRLLAIMFIPNPENKPEVNHKDGDKLNNNLSNLEWSTSSENRVHAYSIGLGNSNRKQKNNSSGFIGVTSNNVIDLPWRWRLQHNKIIHSGESKTKEEAALARDNFIITNSLEKKFKLNILKIAS